MKTKTLLVITFLTATFLTSKAQFFICYKNDKDLLQEICIEFNKNGKATNIKYKGKPKSIRLTFIKTETLSVTAYPTDENYYKEMQHGKKNGEYKLTHAGIWHYVVYERNDGKTFTYTIDHESSIKDGSYRTTPCF